MDRKSKTINLIVADQNEIFTPSDAQIDAFTNFLSVEYLKEARTARLKMQAAIDSVHIDKISKPETKSVVTQVTHENETKRAQLMSQLEIIQAQLKEIDSFEAANSR